MRTSYFTVYLLPSLLLLLHCDSRVQSSQETVHACPGEIVIIPCTIPTRTQQWRAPDLDIARSLAAADLNEAVPPDRPFQFAVTNVTLNGSIISTATVNFTGSLNGTIVSCRDGYLIFPNEQRTMLKLKAPPGAPRTPTVTFPIPGQMFQFSWDAHGPLQDSDAHLITMSGPDDLCGSRDTPFRSSENIHTCSGWSPTGQKYSLSVRAVNCGGEGPASDLASVWLQKPSRPALTTTPLYDSSGRLVEIESQAIAGPPGFIAAGVDSSPTEYIFTYDSGSESLQFTQPCNGGSCQHTFRITNTSQVQQYTVSVAVRNVVGVGTASAPVTIGLVNDLLAVHPNSCIPQVVCQFLNRTIAFASCQISFSTDPTYANLTNTDLANSTNIANVTVPLGTKLRPDTLYYYDVLAVGDSMPIRIKGNFTTDGLCEGTPKPTTSGVGHTIEIASAAVALVTAVVVVVILGTICICHRKGRARNDVESCQSQLEVDGPPENETNLLEASIPLLQGEDSLHTYMAQMDNPPTSEKHQGERPLIPEDHPQHPLVLELPEKHPSASEEHPTDEEDPCALEKHPTQEEHPSLEKLPVPNKHPSAPDPALPLPEENLPPEKHSRSEELCDAAQNDIPSPPSPPPVTETPLPESPPASSQKYSTPVKQLEEILEARDKEQRGEAPVLNDSPTPPAVRSATSEPCVGHPLQPRTAEKAQEDSPDLNAQVLQSSFHSDVMYRFPGQDPTTSFINSTTEETSFINNAVMETQIASMGSSEVVSRVRIPVRTPVGQSLGRTIEGNPNKNQSGEMISDLSPFHGHGGESEKMGPQVSPQRDPAALSGHAVASSKPLAGPASPQDELNVDVPPQNMLPTCVENPIPEEHSELAVDEHPHQLPPEKHTGPARGTYSRPQT